MSKYKTRVWIREQLDEGLPLTRIMRVLVEDRRCDHQWASNMLIDEVDKWERKHDRTYEVKKDMPW